MHGFALSCNICTFRYQTRIIREFAINIKVITVQPSQNYNFVTVCVKYKSKISETSVIKGSVTTIKGMVCTNWSVGLSVHFGQFKSCCHDFLVRVQNKGEGPREREQRTSHRKPFSFLPPISSPSSSSSSSLPPALPPSIPRNSETTNSKKQEG